MTAPRLEACYFGPGVDGRWNRLAQVLRATARQHCPTWAIHVHDVPVTLLERGKRQEALNTAKLEYWNERVQSAADGDRVLLIDVDTFIVRPIDDIWDRAFDLAYTARSSIFPLNGGVVFLRISAPVKAFFATWVAENRRLLEHRSDQSQEWRARCGGINQASFVAVMNQPHAIAILALPCAEWNCEDTSWAAFDPNVTRIVHVKSALRLACLDTQPVPPALATLASLWKSISRQTQQLEEARAS
jgi:hypothetical protein